MNDNWAAQKNTPQTTSATTSISMLQDENGSESIFVLAQTLPMYGEFYIAQAK